jgi:chemotaxis response regulator CheB
MKIRLAHSQKSVDAEYRFWAPVTSEHAKGGTGPVEHRDIIVSGASAGGLDAIRQIPAPDEHRRQQRP